MYLAKLDGVLATNEADLYSQNTDIGSDRINPGIERKMMQVG